jgi:hypothetical protein
MAIACDAPGPNSVDAIATVDGASSDAASLVDASRSDGWAADASRADGAPGDSGVSSDAGSTNACQLAGGICVGDVGSCLAGGGGVLPQGAAGCVFSDGPGVCCDPPPAAPTGDSCLDHGGLCAPISGCNFVNGSFAAAEHECTGLQLCCVEATVCGPETIHCCDETGPTSYRPVCDRGTFECSHIPGTVPVPIGMCGL